MGHLTSLSDGRVSNREESRIDPSVPQEPNGSYEIEEPLCLLVSTKECDHKSIQTKFIPDRLAVPEASANSGHRDPVADDLTVS